VQELKILITPGTSYIHKNRLFDACEKEKMLIVEHEVTVVILKTKFQNRKCMCYQTKPIVLVLTFT